MTNLKANVVIDLNGNLPAQSERFRKNIEDMASSGARKLAVMGRATATLSNQIDRLGNRAAIGVGGLGFLFNRTFIKTAAEFERFHTILETVEGSSEKAKQSMDWVTDFAAKTPYELAQVTDAFVRLRAYGMDPIKGGMLTTLGDAASAMGKPLESAVEAIADAVTGENERLKEFGIKARAVGKKFVYEYTQNGKTMRKSARANNREQIAATLQTIWNEKYAGATAKMSKNWEGMTSNLSDQWTQFQNRVMQAGAFDYLKGEINGVLGTIDQLQSTGDMDTKAKAFSDELIKGLKAAKEAGQGLYEVLQTVGGAVEFVAEKAGGYDKLAKILASIYLANKALRITGADKAIGKVGSVVVDKISGKRSPKSSTGNPLLDAASRMSAVPVYIVDGPSSVFGGNDKKTPGSNRLGGGAGSWLLRATEVGAVAYGASNLYDSFRDYFGAPFDREGTRAEYQRGIESAPSWLGGGGGSKTKLEIEVKGVAPKNLSVRQVMTGSALDVDVSASVMGLR